MTLIPARDVYPGAIVHVAAFPFDDPADSNPRPALVIAVDRGRAHLRGIYTRHHAGELPIAATPGSGLRWPGFLGDRVVAVRLAQITHWMGDTPADLDPFGDFTAQAA
jgi:hypothetical protein